MKDTVLVTGGAGFLGSALVRRLIKNGTNVALLLRASTDTSRLTDVLPSVTIHHGDLSKKADVLRCMNAEEPSGVFHLAASTVRSGKTADEETVLKTNILGTSYLLDAAAEAKCSFFIQAGSYLEYGNAPAPIREDMRCEPLEFYSLSKLAATLRAQAVTKMTGLPTVTLRIFAPYGPGMEPKRLIYELLRRSIAGEELPLTNPETSRDFVHVEDIVSLFLESMAKAKDVSGEVFNLGTGNGTTLQELVDIVLRQTHSRSVSRWHALPSVVYDAKDSRASMEKTFAHFDWRPKFTVEDGVADTLTWIQSFTSHA